MALSSFYRLGSKTVENLLKKSHQKLPLKRDHLEVKWSKKKKKN